MHAKVESAIRDYRLDSILTAVQIERLRTLADQLITNLAATEEQIAEKISTTASHGYAADDIIGSVKTLWVQTPKPKAKQSINELAKLGLRLLIAVLVVVVTLLFIFDPMGNFRPDPKLSHLNQSKHAPVTPPKPHHKHFPIRLPNNDTLFAEDFGDKWPFTVPLVAIRCISISGGGKAIVVEYDGIKCGLNGTAKSAFSDLSPLELIWREDPKIPGARINISPIIERGLQLCR